MAGRLEERAMLAKLTIKSFHINKKDKGATIEAQKALGAKEGTGNYTKKILPKESLDAVRALERELYEYHISHTLPWGDNGMRILLAKNYDKHSAKIREMSGKIGEEADKFCDLYPSFVRDARRQLNGMWNELDYPEVGAIREKFIVKFSVLPMPTAQDFRVDLQSDAVDEIRAEIEAQNDLAMRSAMADLWQRLAGVVRDMADKLKDPNAKRFHESMITNIEELLSVIPDISIADDPMMINIMEEIRAKLTANSLTAIKGSSAIKSQVSADADAILKKMAGYCGVVS